MSGSERDESRSFDPKLDGAGLLTVVVEDADTRETLMLAHATPDAVRLTVETGLGHFWSRSRGTLWRKGESSGNELAVERVLVDCDQDAVLYRARIRGDGAACHTGRRSCFYRALESAEGTLRFLDGA